MGVTTTEISLFFSTTAFWVLSTANFFPFITVYLFLASPLLSDLLPMALISLITVCYSSVLSCIKFLFHLVCSTTFMNAQLLPLLTKKWTSVIGNTTWGSMQRENEQFNRRISKKTEMIYLQRLFFIGLDIKKRVIASPWAKIFPLFTFRKAFLLNCFCLRKQ